MIQKHDLPILEYDFDSIEVIRPNHGAEQLILPEKCVFGFLGDVIDDYAFEMDAVIAEHFETITKSYPVYIVQQNGLEFCLCQAPLGAAAAAQLLDFLISCGCKKKYFSRFLRSADRFGRKRIPDSNQGDAR